MAERVQVQGLGGAVPGIQPTIQRAGQYSVGQRRAGRNKLMDLADALGQVNPALQSYGQIQEFQFQEGAERGAMEASTVDLEQSIEGLDATGEKLVEQGLLPRSQLVGYQRAFRKRIGQRQARTTYFKALNDRLNEVTQNLDSDADIIDSIIAEEKTKAMEQIGGSQFALQGFADYSEAIENNFFTNATKKRDRAVQDYNESMVIEDLNQDFGELFTQATSPNDIAQVQLQLKNKLDQISTEGRIPRSRVIELAWNGFAVPNINNLLIGDKPQPDKAEKMLDSLLDIDLTGKGGKLGNINREGAYIRSKAVQLRSSIEKTRDSIEADKDLKAKDIMNLYMPAAQAIQTGETGDEMIDGLQRGTIIDFLTDAGYSNEEATEESYKLLRSKDLNKFQTLGLNYRLDDSKRDAWNAATGSINSFTINLVGKANAVLSRSEIEQVEKEIDDELSKNPEANVNTILAAKGITDPRVKAKAVSKSVEAQRNLWFEKTDSFRKVENEFEDALDSVIDVTLFEEAEPAVRKSLKSESRSIFQEQYKTKLRELQSVLKDDPDRDVKITREIPTIQKEILKSWTDFKTLEKQFRDGQVKEIIEGEELEIPEIPDLEEAEENIDNVLNSWVEGLFSAYAPSLLPFGTVGEIVEATAKREEIEREIIRADIPLNAKDRSKAFSKADYIEGLLNTDQYKDNTDLQEGVKLIRQFYGYRTPFEIDQDMADDLDFRFTPMYENEEALIKEGRQGFKEIKEYIKSPQKLEIDKFPIYKMYNQKFGINTVEHLRYFVETQKKVLKLRSK
jgi:hypothetical protein